MYSDELITFTLKKLHRDLHSMIDAENLEQVLYLYGNISRELANFFDFNNTRIVNNKRLSKNDE